MRAPREDGSAIAPNDPFWDDLRAAATAAKADPMLWLEQRQYFGDLADQPRFATAFSKWLRVIWADGIEAAIDLYLES